MFDSQLTSLAQLDILDAAHRSLNVEQWVTANGTQVLFAPVPQLPMFDLVLDFDAGSARDGHQPGLAAATLGMLEEGLSDMDAAAIAETFDALGARLANDIGRDYATLSLRCLSSATQRERAVALLARLLSEPLLAEQPLEQIKGQLLNGLYQRYLDPEQRLKDTAHRELYAGHPYALPSFGRTATVKTLEARDLQAFHQRYYTARNLRISLVGNLTRTEAEVLVEHLTAMLPAGERAGEIAIPDVYGGNTLRIATAGGSNTQLLIALPAVERSHPDYPALALGNRLFGGGRQGWLYQELRARRGLAYSVASSFEPLAGQGWYRVQWSIAAAYAEASQDRVRALLQQFLQDGPQSSEVQLAQQQAIAAAPLEAASNAQILKRLVTVNRYGLALPQVEDQAWDVRELTATQIRDAMARALDPSTLLQASLGPTVEQQDLPEPQAK